MPIKLVTLQVSHVLSTGYQYNIRYTDIINLKREYSQTMKLKKLLFFR